MSCDIGSWSGGSGDAVSSIEAADFLMESGSSKALGSIRIALGSAKWSNDARIAIFIAST